MAKLSVDLPIKLLNQVEEIVGKCDVKKFIVNCILKDLAKDKSKLTDEYGCYPEDFKIV